eukprot:Pgem_evm1s7369
MKFININSIVLSLIIASFCNGCTANTIDNNDKVVDAQILKDSLLFASATRDSRNGQWCDYMEKGWSQCNGAGYSIASNGFGMVIE